jgi:hypothetical protein
VPGTVTGKSEINWLSTVRGRIGFAWDRVLVYGTGGLAIADADFKVSIDSPAGSYVLNLKRRQLPAAGKVRTVARGHKPQRPLNAAASVGLSAMHNSPTPTL